MQVDVTTNDLGLLTQRSKNLFRMSSRATELDKLTAQSQHIQNSESR
jgi:hypothetical protein